jgi:hypothetical protein
MKFSKKMTEFVPFFNIKPILPDCRANIARLAWFAQETGGAGAPPAPPPGTPMHKNHLKCNVSDQNEIGCFPASITEKKYGEKISAKMA